MTEAAPAFLPPKDYSKEVETIQDLFLDGKVRKAQRKTRRILKDDPNNPGANSMMARMAIAVHDYDHVEKFLRHDPKGTMATLINFIRPDQSSDGLQHNLEAFQDEENRLRKIPRDQISADDDNRLDLFRDILEYQAWLQRKEDKRERSGKREVKAEQTATQEEENPQKPTRLKMHGRHYRHVVRRGKDSIKTIPELKVEEKKNERLSKIFLIGGLTTFTAGVATFIMSFGSYAHYLIPILGFTGLASVPPILILTGTAMAIAGIYAMLAGTSKEAMIGRKKNKNFH